MLTTKIESRLIEILLHTFSLNVVFTLTLKPIKTLYINDGLKLQDNPSRNVRKQQHCDTVLVK